MPSFGGWSATVLRSGMGFPMAAGFAALVIVLVFLTAAIARVVRSMRALIRAERSVRRLRPTVGDLVVIDDDVPAAYSVGGIHGRIVVSRSMLAVLDADERCALIAHEASHLRHRHQLYIHLTEVATAANPLLRPVATAVRRGVERWADEDAAVEVSDRTVVARAIAKAALASSGRAHAFGLAIAGDRVVERVEQLMLPAPRQRRLVTVTVLAAAVVTWVTTLALADWANNLVQLAEAVHGRH
jgi:beta-lactamase regulating signal transducer with metallopeptidase domain